MQAPEHCRYCESKEIRIVRVNPRGREVTFIPFWVFLGLSLLILISSFFGTYGNSSNHLITAIPGLILVLTAVFCLLLVARMPKKFKCNNSHVWE
jgi:hypothetical protein